MSDDNNDNVHTFIGEHYDIAKVAAKNPRASTIRNDIRTILLTDGQECWEDMERFLLPPGVEGSAQFDHMSCVMFLRQHDKGDLLKNVTGASLWRELVKVLRGIGFNVTRGRISGLIEDQSEAAD